MRIAIIADAFVSLSGGDRIFIELARQWARAGHEVVIFTTGDGERLCRSYGLDDVVYETIEAPHGSLGLSYYLRTRRALAKIRRLESPRFDVVYSASDFFPDVLVARALKRRCPAALWVAGFYLFAPAPFSSGSPYRGLKRFKGIAYYLLQRPMYKRVNKEADIVFVTSQPDVSAFDRGGGRPVFVVRGGVDMAPARSYAQSGQSPEKIYDAVFVGRFHYQKGVVELADIWDEVVSVRPGSRLAIIGEGPLESELKARIKKLGLESSIDVMGFMDGEEKYEVFRKSRIVVHPATYDSGGMAACEAMAWGLPGVSYDLEALKTYYPKGMVRVPCFDKKAFAEAIVHLLDDGTMYAETSKDAAEWASEWDWPKRAAAVMEVIENRQARPRPFFALGNGLGRKGTMGGSARIFIELVKRWTDVFDITLISHPDGIETCADHGLAPARSWIPAAGGRPLEPSPSNDIGSVLYHVRSMRATTAYLEDRIGPSSIVFSGTDFLMDALPASRMKKRLGDQVTWIAGFWLFAPRPFSKNTMYKGFGKLKGLLFYLYQIPVYRRVRKYADIVFVASQPDATPFINGTRDASKVIVVKGGVDTSLAGKAKPLPDTRYDVVFVGRIHPQKGVLELADIWSKVVAKRPGARLAVIGVGPQEEELKAKIKALDIEKSVDMLGFLDGIEKFNVLKSSRATVHTSVYDSGGMATMEGMSAGLPAVSFDLEALKTYYPRGVVKVPCFDTQAFADSILNLLEDESLYRRISDEAVSLSKEWDWDVRAAEVLAALDGSKGAGV